MSYYNLQHKIQAVGLNMGPLHTHDFFELEFLVSGERHYFTKTQMYKLHAPSLLVLAPHSTHKFESNGCEVYTLQISPESLSEDQINFLNYLAKKALCRFQSKNYRPCALRTSIYLKSTRLSRLTRINEWRLIPCLVNCFLCFIRMQIFKTKKHTILW